MNRLSARIVYIVFVTSTSFFFTIWASLSALYRIQVVGLDPLQLVLLGTALELAVFIFEVPTGIVADIYSRRLSVIIGMILLGLGFVLEGLFPVFGIVLAAQVVWGIGATFESGAIDAWITDETSEEQANQLFLRASQIGQVTSILAIIIAVILGNISLAIPMVVGGMGYLLLSLFLMFFMPEKNFQKHESSHNPFKAFKQTFGSGLNVARSKPLLVSIFAITAIVGAFSETFDRLSEAHFLDIGLPTTFSTVTWFGIIQIVISLVSIVFIQRIQQGLNVNNHYAVARTLLIFNTVLMVCVVLFGLAGNFVIAFAFYAASLILRGLKDPLSKAWLNQNLESRTRATVFSMNSQMDAIGQLSGGPILGLVAKTFSISVAFVIAGLFLLPASFLYFRTLGQKDRGEKDRGEKDMTNLDSE
jgi:MFS transporter, DHA3 family, tetracycline resistance protein